MPNVPRQGIKWTVTSDDFMPTLQPDGHKVALAKNTPIRVELPKGTTVLILNSGLHGDVRFSASYLPENKMRHFSASEEDLKKHCTEEDLEPGRRAMQIRDETLSKEKR